MFTLKRIAQRTAPCGVLTCLLLGLASNVSARSNGDLNDPGSWAYEGCKQGLLNDIRQNHPQVQAIQIEGHVTEIKETDQKSELRGKAKYSKDGDMRHITFTCTVDRDEKKIRHVEYDKD